MGENPSVVQFNTAHRSPITTELTALFDELHDSELLKTLKTYYAGRRGYGLEVLWRTYVAQSYLSLPSVAALIRALQDNPALREACGILSIERVPSKFAYSRFLAKLSNYQTTAKMKDVFRELTRRCYEQFEGYGENVAIDSADLKAFSNGRHKTPTDKDAGWVVKTDNHGKRKYIWGYKIHLLADATHEIPVAAVVTPGNASDVTKASNVLAQARYTWKGHTGGTFAPLYVSADAGYSSSKLRHLIRDQYTAYPIIKVNKGHKRALKAEPEDAEFKRIYSTRTSVERVFSRLKSHRSLNNITHRGLRKVTVHVFMRLIVQVAQALAMPKSPRQLVRAA